MKLNTEYLPSVKSESFHSFVDSFARDTPRDVRRRAATNVSCAAASVQRHGSPGLRVRPSNYGGGSFPTTAFIARRRIGCGVLMPRADRHATCPSGRTRTTPSLSIPYKGPNVSCAGTLPETLTHTLHDPADTPWHRWVIHSGSIGMPGHSLTVPDTQNWHSHALVDPCRSAIRRPATRLVVWT